MSPYEPRPEGLNTQPAPPSVVETLRPRTWHKGAPPHVGWWNANTIRSETLWRWWDGNVWSHPVSSMSDRRAAQLFARRPETAAGNAIKWTDAWPENARVPRVNPNEVKA